MRVVVVGAGSFIATALREDPHTAGWRFLAGREVFPAATQGATAPAPTVAAALAAADVVVNCAFDSRLKSQFYDPSLDMDLRLAGWLRDFSRAHYVMLSTRMVYGPSAADGRLVETMPAQPVNAYGRAKLETEFRVGALLGGRLTVLRLSNIFGFECDPERRTFLGTALRSLRNQGRIVLDMSPFVERDFLPVSVLANWIPALLERLEAGVFNLGAGRPVPTGRIAQWLIEGYGHGELLVVDLREHDGFWLDMQRAEAAFGLASLAPAVVREHCIRVGQCLRVALDAGDAAMELK